MRARRKAYSRKRLKTPRGSDLPRIILILKHLNKHGRFPQLDELNAPTGPDDDPIADHIARLERVLAGQSAEEVFGQRTGGGRPTKADSHYHLAVAYYEARGFNRPYRLTHAKACAVVRAQRAEWARLNNETIRRYAREQRAAASAFENFTDLDAPGTENRS
jgi:hypothetical protein